MRAVIKEKREVAQGTLLVVFDLQGEVLDFRAGQYFWVELPNRGHDDDKGLRRHISVVTSPTERLTHGGGSESSVLGNARFDTKAWPDYDPLWREHALP